VSPFQPVGDKARWRVVYEQLNRTPVDGVLTYESLGEALDLDPADDRHSIQMAMRRAAKEHEEVDRRAIEPIMNVGYRVVQAKEHLGLARAQQRRAGHALKRGRSKVVNVDFNQIDVETRKAFEVVAYAFQMQSDMVQRLDVRNKKLAEKVAAITARTETVEMTSEEHAERLGRLEQLIELLPAADPQPGKKPES